LERQAIRRTINITFVKVYIFHSAIGFMDERYTIQIYIFKLYARQPVVGEYLSQIGAL
jgi:hypothetical protein